MIKMSTKLLVFSFAFTLINTVTKSSAQYSYEVYEVYPQSNTQSLYYQPQNSQQQDYVRPQQSYALYNQNPYQQYQNTHGPQYQYQTVQQPQQQQYTNQQRTYTQNPNVQVSVADTEWVCTNPKTNDMMIIAVDDSPGPRSNGPPQWHQVHPQANQPNYVQPQPTFGDPTYQQVNPTYSTTEKAESPVWQNNNNYQPTQPQVHPTTETYTTTEREPGPIWSSGGDATTKKTVYTTTPRPLGPIWSTNDGNKNDNNGNKGFTVEDKPTTHVPFNPFFDPTTGKPKTTTTATDPDDDEPIEIVMGK